MKKFVLMLLVFSFPLTSFGAISFGGDLGGVGPTGGVTQRCLTGLTLTGATPNGIILAGIRSENTNRTHTSIVLDDGAGGALQNFSMVTATYLDLEANNHRVSYWYLVNPTVTNTRICGNISASDVMSLGAVFYTGVAQTNVFTVANVILDANSPGNQVETSDTDGSWAVGLAESTNQGMSVGANTLVRGYAGTGSQDEFVDGNVDVANAGTHTLNFTWVGQAGWITAMMRPSTGEEPPPEEPATTTTATTTAMQAETFATVLFVSGFAILFYIMVYTVKRFTKRR